MAGETNQFRSSKMRANPPSQKLRKYSFPSSAENSRKTKQK